MILESGKKIYFASDFHLGAPDYKTSRSREDRVVRWLNEVKQDAQEIFLVGDVFDFWFEYKHAVPKGYVRLLGTIAAITDSGIPVHFFTGNHDMWAFDYLPKEVGVIMHREPIKLEINNKKFYIGHGDGLGPGDHGYKFIKSVFRSPVSQWLFARLHPNLGISMADYWSKTSRVATGNEDEKFLGEDKEWLVQYCREILTKQHFDYFIFGHRHLPLNINLSGNSKYINLGDWIKYNTFGCFDGNDLKLEIYKK